MTEPEKKETKPADDKRWRMVDAVMRRNGYRGDALIETLHAVQETYGYLDEQNMRNVAAALNLPLSKVYGVATFYHFFNLKPKGRHTCVVCLGTACYIKGADAILDRIREVCGVKDGETTADQQLSVMTARCIGSCSIAPVVVLDEQVLGQVKPDQVIAAIKDLKK